MLGQFAEAIEDYDLFFTLKETKDVEKAANLIARATSKYNLKLFDEAINDFNALLLLPGLSDKKKSKILRAIQSAKQARGLSKNEKD